MHVLANILRSRYNTPAVWTKWNGARSRRVDVIAGDGSLRRHQQCACAACVRRAVGLADYRWALPRISMVLPCNPCTDCKSAQYCTTRGHPVQLPQLTSAGPCKSVSMRPRKDRQTHRQTDNQTRVTTIHFASSTTHAKCNNVSS